MLLSNVFFNQQTRRSGRFFLAFFFYCSSMAFGCKPLTSHAWFHEFTSGSAVEGVGMGVQVHLS